MFSVLVVKTYIEKLTFQNRLEGGALQHCTEVQVRRKRRSDYQVLEVGSKLEVYGTAAMVNFCKPLPPIR